MQLPDTLTDAQSEAVIDCLRIFAARGRALREERERQQKIESPYSLAAAGDSRSAHGTNILAKVGTDATS